MNRTVLFLFIAPLAFCLPAYAQVPASDGGSAPPGQRTISVSGQAEIRVVPDQILISMTAENRGPDLLATKSKNDSVVKGLVAYFTKTLEIEPRYIQTDYVSISPEYRRCDYDDELSGKCSPLDIVYYSVRKGVQIWLNNPEKYEALVTKSLELGVRQIDNIQFISTEMRKHRDEARDLAAKAAQEKARAIAATMGMKVVKPISISTENYSSFYWNGYGASQRGGNTVMQNVTQQAPSPAGDSSADLALGQINISAQVNVTFDMQ